jgi:NADPH2:quinone reductase
MPRAIRIHEFGDSSVLRYEEIPDPTPKPGEAVVSIEAVGVNFLDVYHRQGVYPIPLPITLGQEGA